MPIAVIVNWYGPYRTTEELRRAAMDVSYYEGKATLYMALGNYNKYRYIGRTDRPESRFLNHKQLGCKENKRFYFGKIVSQAKAGRRRKKVAPTLDLAEQTLVGYLRPEKNTNFIDKVPEDCVSVFSRFFDFRDYETPTNPLPRFPRLLAYDCWAEQWYP